MDPSPDMSTMTNHTAEQVASHESKLVTVYNSGNEVAQNENQSKTQTKNSSMSKCCKALQNIFCGFPNDYMMTVAY